MKSIKLFTLTALTSILVSTNAFAEKIKIGVMSGPEHEVAEIAAKVAKEKYGLDVEYVLFNDYALPNTAVSKGDLDANAMQHKPYLDKDSSEKKLTNLVIVGRIFEKNQKCRRIKRWSGCCRTK